MGSQRIIVLVLRSGGAYSFKDVELITRHILGRWVSSTKPRIILLWDKATEAYDMGNIEVLPLTNNLPGTWSRMQLYSPEMEKYRPFLYLDLDTAIIQSVEKIFDLVTDTSKFIVLEDLWQGKELIATPVVWFPANSDKIQRVWNAHESIVPGFRMDYFLRKVTTADMFWQKLTDGIIDFKPVNKVLLDPLPDKAILVCFHGKPRIFNATGISWVRSYVNFQFSTRNAVSKRVTVVIPYKTDRGWLKEAVNSVPEGVQLILSQGEGNWPSNFNKVLNKAEGEYIRWLHEDDMLTDNSIEDSIKAIEEQNVDFIHGNALEIKAADDKWSRIYVSPIARPTLQDMLLKNTIHQVTLMYRREVFEKIGGLNETLNVMEEYEFNLRCLKAGLKIGYCPSMLGCYRRHPQQKVRVVPMIEKNEEREMVKSMYR